MLVRARFKIIPTSNSLNSTGFRDRRYTEIPVLCYQRQKGVCIRGEGEGGGFGFENFLAQAAGTELFLTYTLLQLSNTAKRAPLLSKQCGREGNTHVHARVYDSSTWPSFHITSLLRWQTAPQPFVIITEPFQLKDKSSGLPSACYLEHGHGAATHFWEDSQRAGGAHSSLPPGISGDHTTALLLRRKSQEKNLILNKMEAPSSLCTGVALVLPWEMQTLYSEID